MKDIKYIIADNVRLCRKRQNLTQAELAERAELSLDSIKRIESGKRTMSLENFLRLSNALHVPSSYLLYAQVDKIPEVERIQCILRERSKRNIWYIYYKRWRQEWISYR